MVERRIIKDVSKTKRKLFFGRTARELLGIVFGIGIIIVSYFWLLAGLGTSEFRYVIAGLLGVPFFLIGFVPLYGTTFEKGIKLLIQDQIFTPKVRFYHTEDSDTSIMNTPKNSQSHIASSHRKEYRAL